MTTARVAPTGPFSARSKTRKLTWEFLEQLRFFPKAKHDDGLDALEMAVRISQQPVVEEEEFYHLNPETLELEPGLADAPPRIEIDPDVE